MRGEGELSYEFGPFRLDLSEQLLVRDGLAVRLTPKTFAVLRVLVENAGHLVDKERLIAEVWPDNFVEEGALNRSISVLRKALCETEREKYIDTVPKRGYRFVAPVTVQGPATPRQAVDDRAARAFVMRRAARAFVTRRAAAAGIILITAVVVSIVELRRMGEKGGPRSAAIALHRQVTFTGKEGGPALSPDGRRIAYVSGGSPEKRVIVQELAGGGPLVIFAAPETGHLRWSPDGTELLVWARGAGFNGVYLIPQMGGTPRLVAPGMYIACWMDDGSTIAVPGYIGGTIAFFDRTGRRQRTMSLRDVSWSIWDIDWSPLAGLLTFTSSNEQGRFTLWTVRRDGREQTAILAENTPISSARWTPDGSAIYVLRTVNQTDSLYRIPLGGNAVGVLTGLETDQSFALSADGRRLVYARTPFYSNLWTIDLDVAGGTPTELTHGTSLLERPRISPNGRSIAFNVGREPTANVYTMPIRGGPPRQLTFLPSFNMTGGWSADGESIAFASNQDGTPRVWLVSAGGGSPRALSNGDMSESFEVAWSPGPAILYQQAGNRNYYQLDPATGAERPFVADSSVGWMFSPVYSPDGTRVAVMWNRRPDRGIWIVDTRTRDQRLLLRTTAASLMPIAWAADGAGIYAVEGKPTALRGRTTPLGETITDARIVMIPLTGAPTTVVTLPSAEIGGVAMTRDARTFVYTVYSSGSDVWIVDDFDPLSPVRLAAKR